MPTATDEKLGSDLTELRVEVERRFGSVDKSLGGIERELKLIRWVGTFFAAILVALVAGSINVAWNASAVVSDVKQQGQRIDKFEKRLDGIESKLDTLIRQTAPKSPDRLDSRKGAAVTDDIEALRFNTAISRLMEFTNFFTAQDVRPRSAMETFTLLLAPMAPHPLADPRPHTDPDLRTLARLRSRFAQG